MLTYNRVSAGTRSSKSLLYLGWGNGICSSRCWIAVNCANKSRYFSRSWLQEICCSTGSGLRLSLVLS